MRTTIVGVLMFLSVSQTLFSTPVSRTVEYAVIDTCTGERIRSLFRSMCSNEPLTIRQLDTLLGYMHLLESSNVEENSCLGFWSADTDLELFYKAIECAMKLGRNKNTYVKFVIRLSNEINQYVEPSEVLGERMVEFAITNSKGVIAIWNELNLSEQKEYINSMEDFMQSALINIDSLIEENDYSEYWERYLWKKWTGTLPKSQWREKTERYARENINKIDALCTILSKNLKREEMR